MGAPAASQAAIKRALDAAKDCGLMVTGFTVSKDGTIQVETAAASVDSDSSNVQPLRPKQWAKR